MSAHGARVLVYGAPRAFKHAAPDDVSLTHLVEILASQHGGLAQVLRRQVPEDICASSKKHGKGKRGDNKRVCARVQKKERKG